MTIKHSKEANLGPFDLYIGFVLWLQDVENNGHTVFIVISYNPLVGVGGVRLYDTALLLRGFGWLVVLQLNSLWVQRGWVFAKQQSLNLHELNVRILVLLARKRCRDVHTRAIFVLLGFGLSRCGERIVLRRALRSCVDVGVYRSTNILPVLSWS